MISHFQGTCTIFPAALAVASCAIRGPDDDLCEQWTIGTDGDCTELLESAVMGEGGAGLLGTFASSGHKLPRLPHHGCLSSDSSCDISVSPPTGLVHPGGPNIRWDLGLAAESRQRR